MRLQCFVMAKTPDEQAREDAIVEEIAAELKAKQGRMTAEEWISVFRRLPKSEFSSAEYIRELRGPLPEDDPEYQRFHARR